MTTSSSGRGSSRLAERLNAARDRSFVGREGEIATFRSALAGAPDAPIVLYVHGPGGVGKTALLHRFAALAQGAGRIVVQVDGRMLDPTPAAFQLHGGAARSDDRVVLLVDNFERCQGLEAWVREQFLPSVLDGVVVVLAGRQPPHADWRSDGAWDEALVVCPLADLSPDDAAALVRARDVPPESRNAVLRFAGGYPLALSLAASVAARDIRDTAAWTLPRDVLSALLQQLVGDVPSPAHRTALEVCAHTLSTTEDLLAAVVPDVDAVELFGWLRGLPFVEADRHGLRPHDVVREVLEADLRWRNPRSYEEMHRRVTAHLVARARETTPVPSMAEIRSLYYLQRHDQIVTEYFVLDGDGTVYPDAYQPADRNTVRRLALVSEGAESAAIVDFWLQRQPQAFTVYRRSTDDELVAFMAWLQLTNDDEDTCAVDPVVAAAWTHAASTAPLRGREQLALARFLIYPPAYYEPSAPLDLMRMRILAGWMGTPHLAWSYVVNPAPASFWEPLHRYLEQLPVPAVPTVGGRPYALFAHDWRAMPVDAWFDLLNTRLLHGWDPRAPATPEDLVVLPRAEFDAAVRRALRSWHRPDQLAESPLIRSRIVTGRRTADPVHTLREALAAAVAHLAADPRATKLHRAATVTFLKATPSQEAAAERLGVPFSTYRRHLAGAVDRIVDHLWQRELHASAEPPTPE
ncbi:ATP-binding protein [Cryptosporangium aurantiacum]|uniref:AAA ATPase domain-containing protein n=1 Tax=Cryptosporangium aurantiacum TaxID=134849 RepID=A0A1M7REJ1_9ACTN|nr:ATP-binding protein [Cryptosporangium aurantiacum]SHN44705.1 AAA ATPase domain-containing protein [Cryptosporangium aurantiacum]